MRAVRQWLMLVVNRQICLGRGNLWGELVYEVDWLFRAGELFIFRGNHVSVDWQVFNITLRRWWMIEWYEIPIPRRDYIDYKWVWLPKVTMYGYYDKRG